MADCISPYDLTIHPSFPANTKANVPRITNDLVAKGIEFNVAWSNATCSPTRSVIQTGRYGFRTGIGKEIERNGNDVGLPATEIILPKLLDDHAPETWSHAAFGKWHLSEEEYNLMPPGPTKPANAPDSLGYSFYQGQIFTLTGSQFYCKPPAGWSPWTYWESSPGVAPVLRTALDTDVLIDRQTQDALDWIKQTPSSDPWLCYLAYQAPFELHRAPITGTYTTPIGPAFSDCEKCTGATQKRPCFLAYMESLDTQIGELLDGITFEYGADWWTTTTVFFIADNGTPSGVTHPLIDSGQHKATQTEGALAVPYIISGASVPMGSQGKESDALVHAVDFFATIATVAGIDLNPGGVPIISDLDSFDLTPILSDPLLANPTTPRRTYIYSEIFPVNVEPSNLPVLYGFENRRIARDGRYKYVFRPTSGPNAPPDYYLVSGHRGGDEFYDLGIGEDPTNDNLNGPSLVDEVAHPGGEAARVALLASIRDLLGVQ